ncbi:MAG: hypothetical protein ACE5JP_04645 [Candidatus Bipolaricaulia bacterium]
MEEKEVQRLETELQKIEDILRARVVTGRVGEIIAIHILARAKRSPHQVVRDVETLINTLVDKPIDHRKISVAQIAGEGEEVSDRLQVTAGIRLVISAVNVSTMKDRVWCEVRFSVDDKELIGEAEGKRLDQNLLRVAAEATLNAFEEYLNKSWSFAVEEIRTIPLISGQAIIVRVRLLIAGREEVLLGIAPVGDSPSEDAVKATLNAVNRRISTLITK